MDNTFVVNIIHRPEMVPEYAEKVTGQGKAEDIGSRYRSKSVWITLPYPPRKLSMWILATESESLSRQPL